jgi:capsid portal protein
LIFNEDDNPEEALLIKRKTEEELMYPMKKTSIKKINQINKFLRASEIEDSKTLRKCNLIDLLSR